MAGNYISYDVLEDRMGTGILDNLIADSEDPDLFVEAIIKRAESLIDSYAKKLYVVPLPASALTEEWALVLAEYELYKRGAGNDIPAKYRLSRVDVLAQLQALAKGELIPPDGDDGTAVERKTSTGNSIDFQSETSMFDMTSTKMF